MKILSCYIAGFGKFSSREFDFSSDLVVIKEENGWGKTTLADFVRCMFYGQDAGRGKALESNDRAKYLPWNGGAYGGSLTFLYQNKRYRIERSFGKTPAYDTARLYDGNNMQVFDFGDRCERLGESLFGMDADAYRRSVYIPQGEIRTGGLPDDIKNRLLALLNTGGADGNGSALALEKLDAADKALRAKRKPGKGKLDEIDERLAELEQQKSQREYAVLQAQQLRKEVAETEEKIRGCCTRLEQLAKAMEIESRRSELEVKRQVFADAQSAVQAAEQEIATLNAFFLQVDPATVNLDGIRGAVSDFYAQKEKLSQTQARLNDLEVDYQKLVGLKAQKDACGKILDSYDAILEKQSKQKKKRKKKGRLIEQPKRKSNVLILALGLLLAVVGAVLTDTDLWLGLGTLAVGLFGMIFVFFRVLPRREKVKNDVDNSPKIDPEFSKQYDEVYNQLDEVEEQLAAMPQGLEEEYLRLAAERDSGRATLGAREQGIKNFFANFRFTDIYDYRAAVTALEDKIAAHAKARKTLAEQSERAGEFSAENNFVSTGDFGKDMRTLQSEKADCEREQERLLQVRAQAVAAAAEALENGANKEELLAGEEALLEEKRRLEKRHRAILAAKEILIRAKENLAGRYLSPVEKGCRYYLSAFAADGTKSRLCFSAEGTPYYEETGLLREMGYYSVGSRELVDFCIRLAFADAVFQAEKPVLILDDPFVNLDDKKTEIAKKLVKELSKRYQILYLTCKQERQI